MVIKARVGRGVVVVGAQVSLSKMAFLLDVTAQFHANALEDGGVVRVVAQRAPSTPASPVDLTRKLLAWKRCETRTRFCHDAP